MINSSVRDEEFSVTRTGNPGHTVTARELSRSGKTEQGRRRQPDMVHRDNDGLGIIGVIPNSE
jgi:hypothetical protein